MPVVLSEDEEDNNDLDATSMCCEEHRVETFASWPHVTPTPRAMARAGFYFMQQLTTDAVRCIICKGILKLFLSILKFSSLFFCDSLSPLRSVLNITHPPPPPDKEERKKI